MPSDDNLVKAFFYVWKGDKKMYSIVGFSLGLIFGVALVEVVDRKRTREVWSC